MKEQPSNRPGPPSGSPGKKLMDELHGMTVRDLIAALAEAEDVSRLARRRASADNDTGPSEPWQLASSLAREDAIVSELRRRSGIPTVGHPSAFGGGWRMFGRAGTRRVRLARELGLARPGPPSKSIW